MLLQFIDILNAQNIADMLFGDVTDSVVHWINVGAVLSGYMNSDVVCSRNETVSRALCGSALFTVAVRGFLAPGA